MGPLLGPIRGAEHMIKCTACQCLGLDKRGSQLQRSHSAVRFGPFVLDRANALLWQEGAVVELRPRAYHLLEILAGNRGQYVGYEQLMREAWEGVSVSRHTVAVTVGELKKALGEHGEWIRCRAKLGYCLGVPQSDELIRGGLHMLGLFTRESTEKAVACFEEASQLDGGDSRSSLGLCRAHMVLGTLGMRPPLEVYPRFLDALERAVSATGWSAELRGMRAHGLHMFERRLEQAELTLSAAIEEEPHVPGPYIFLAMLLSTSSRLDEAWAALEQGERVDPLWPLLPATESLIRFCERDYENAVRCGKRALELHPYLHLSRAFYAQALEFSGRGKAALAEYRLACAMTPDLSWLPTLEIAGLARAGRKAKATRMMEDLEARREKEYVDAYYMGLAYEALGLRGEAIAQFERAYDENSTTLPILDTDPRIDQLRTDPWFAGWRDRVFRGTTRELGDVAARYSHIDRIERLTSRHEQAIPA